MSTVRIKTPEGLQIVLQRMFEAGLKSSLHSRALQEKEKQAAVTPSKPKDNSGEEEGDSTGLFDDDDSEGDSGAKPSKTVDDESEHMKSGEVTVEDVVGRLNIIRSGRSLKDEAVAAAMSQYVDSLSKEERTALLAFLRGISQIVTGEIEGDDAIEPSSDPAAIAMQKKNAEKSKSVKPNVIKGPSDGGNAKRKGSEDTSGPTPITPKKRA